MSRDPEDIAIIAMVSVGAIAVLCFIGWLLYSGIETTRAQSRCRDRGGNVEHISNPQSDWRCVGARAEVQP